MRISQREARRLRARVNAHEKSDQQLRNGWLEKWPYGVHILTARKGETINESDISIVRTARLLGHPVVIVDYGEALHFYGVK